MEGGGARLRARFTWRVRVVGLAFVLLCASASARGEATYCKPIEGGVGSLARIDADARLEFVRTNLRQGAFDTRIWHSTWSALYGGVAIYQIVSIPFSSHDGKTWHYFGAGGSLLGLGVLQIMPPKVLADAPALELRLVAESGCAALADAERVLTRDAASEAFSISPMVHAGNFAINIGLVLALGLGFHNWNQAALQGGIGAVVGEIQTFTQPRRELHALARYRAGDLRTQRRRAFDFSIAPVLARQQAGLGLGLSF
jgi:hypothetical protein